MMIPYNFKPREYQLPLLRSMDSGIRRAFCLWHRRAGKDKVLWNYLIKEAVQHVGTYYYFFPSYTQAKKVIWDGIDNDGFSFLDHIPKEIIQQKNGVEMKIKLTNGSVIQLIGTDKYDAVRGTNPRGCIFSEYAFHNPIAWEVIRPILAANGGWAIFNTTPNGKNHAYDLYNSAKNNPKWFTQILSVDDTEAVSVEVLNEEQRDMSREMYQQEYFCSFDVGAVGSVYGAELENAKDRITSLPIYPERSIYVASDIGLRDSTALWFYQRDGEFWNVIHSYENNRKQAAFYFRYIKDFIDSNGAQLGRFMLPHDSKNGTMVSDETVFSQAEDYFGAHKVYYHERGRISQRLDTTRRMFSKMKIDPVRCKEGLRCLENYKYKFNILTKVFSKDPDHNWASHSSDAFGYGAEFLSAEDFVDKNVGVDMSDVEEEQSYL